MLLLALAGAGCARGVNDYLAEARSNTQGAVKEAVVAIGGILLKKESAGLPFDEADREALRYLKDVAAADPVPINRVAAMGALGRLRGAEAEAVYLGALKDPFWLVRLAAVNALAAQPREEHVEPLRQLLRSETRPEVRLAVVKALRKNRGPLALRTLLEVFLDRSDGARDPQVHAFWGIRELTGLGYGFDELRSWATLYREKFGAAPEPMRSPGDLRPEPRPTAPPPAPLPGEGAGR